MGRTVYYDFQGNEIDPPKADEVKQTNADRIRSMTDERLAVEMYAKGGCPHDCETPDDMDTDCVQCWLDWLKEEAVSDG